MSPRELTLFLGFIMNIAQQREVMAPGAHVFVDAAPYVSKGAPAETVCIVRPNGMRLFFTHVSKGTLGEDKTIASVEHVAIHEMCHIAHHADQICEGKTDGMDLEEMAERCVAKILAERAIAK